MPIIEDENGDVLVFGHGNDDGDLKVSDATNPRVHIDGTGDLFDGDDSATPESTRVYIGGEFPGIWLGGDDKPGRLLVTNGQWPTAGINGEHGSIGARLIQVDRDYPSYQEVRLNPEGNIELRSPFQDEAGITIENTDHDETVLIRGESEDGGSGVIKLGRGNVSVEGLPTVHLSGEEADLTIGNGVDGGDIFVFGVGKGTSGRPNIHLDGTKEVITVDGRKGEVEVSGDNGGELNIENQDGIDTIRLDGETSTIRIGGKYKTSNSRQGRLEVTTERDQPGVSIGIETNGPFYIATMEIGDIVQSSDATGGIAGEVKMADTEGTETILLSGEDEFIAVGEGRTAVLQGGKNFGDLLLDGASGKSTAVLTSNDPVFGLAGMDVGGHGTDGYVGVWRGAGSSADPGDLTVLLNGLEGVVEAENGFSLQSPNGTRYRIIVDDNGNLVTQPE